MNGKGLIVVSVGIALGGLILNGQRVTNQAFAEVRSDIANLRERMARLEDLFEGHLNRDAPRKNYREE